MARARGLGEDGVHGLSGFARAKIETASLVVGGARHLALASSLIKSETLAWPSPIDEAYPKILARRGSPVVVLASGDPFFYGVGKQLADRISPAEILSIPQPLRHKPCGIAHGLGIAGRGDCDIARPAA